ncbi:MAG: hypothetical protein HIU93_12610 [Acidobacteria bacterium]|nr:hypothetical protein [Acidobacteriota bacterium]
MIKNALYRTLWTGVALAVSIFPAAPAGAQATADAGVVTMPVNNADRVALAGNLRKDLKVAKDLGAADASMTAHHVIVVLQRSADRQASLDQYLSDVQNPHSTRYHQWMTPAEYGSRFGAAADDVQAVAAWLQSQGLGIEKVSPAANMISLSGTVGQLQTAFATSIHAISLNGEKHVANMSEPQIPRALAPVVKGVLGLDDFHPHSNLQPGPTAQFDAQTQRITPDLTLYNSAGTPYLYVDPSDAATIYDTPNAALNPSYKGTTYDGTGVTVGVVGDSNVDLTPVSNYRTAFLGETSGNVNVPTVIIDGSDPGINGDEVETFLDLEVLGGLAPKAKINYYASNDSDLSAGLFNAVERAINDNVVSILSMSYGECEANAGTSTNQFLAEIYQQAAAQGITMTVSSGDSGAAGCDSSAAPSAVNGLAVNGLGSTPYNVSVGGTDYDVLANGFSPYVSVANSGAPPYWRTAQQYIPESPWNDSTAANGALANNVPLTSSSGTNIIGGGGGKSAVYTKPAYQSALTPADGARDVPDVSFLAGNGLYSAVWVICESNQIYGPNCATQNGTFTSNTRFSGVGGTSAATPAFAGMLALVVQSTGSRLGQANNVLYKLAADKYSSVFHDVTTGNNAVVCTAGSKDCGANGFTTGYDAGTGYDLASGLGSVDAAAMVANWSSGVGASSTTTLTIDGATVPVSVTHGASLNFAVGVNPTSATGFAALVNTAQVAAGAPTLNGQAFTIPISGGAGAAAYNGLPGGQYTVYASYGGDTNTAASQSQPISVNIAAEASSTKVWVNAYTPVQQPLTNLVALPYGSYIFVDSSVYGTAEGYTASLGSATGTMTIFDNGAQIGTAPITSGNLASFPAVVKGAYPFAVGAHSVTTTYPGDASYKSNTSNPISFTVVQGATTLQVVPSLPSLQSSSNDTVQVTVLTSSLALAPTGTLTLTANGTTLGTSSSFLTGVQNNGTTFSYFNFNVAGSALQQGQNTLTATYSGDGNYTGSTATGTIALTEGAFTLKTGSVAFDAGASTGNTATISATPLGGFAGLVNLTCAVRSAPANAVSPVTCSVPATINVTGIGTASSTVTVESTSATTAGSYVVMITGTDVATGVITASTTSQVTVNPTPEIALSSSGGITLSPGATAGNTATLTVTPMGGFTGVVSMSCAVVSSPSGVHDPITCAITPATVSISGTTAGTAMLAIGSTGSTVSAMVGGPRLFKGAGGVMIAMGLCFMVPLYRRRRLARLAAVLLMVSLGAMVGCGNGPSSSSGSTVAGTTSGTYAVTVTANPAGGATQTATINVRVN